MREKKDWKVLLQYAAGIFLLLVSVGLAWFLPGWYSAWKDDRFLDQAVLSKREEIEFLDMVSLDMAGRMKLLGESEQLLWSGEIGSGGEGDIIERISLLRSTAAQWKDAGILPREIFPSADTVEAFYHNAYVEDYFFPRILLDQGTLQVCVICMTDDLDGTGILAIIDMEKDILYYLSVRGYTVQEQMAQLLGYSGTEEMAERVIKDQLFHQQEDYASYDFASVCHSREAAVTGSPEELNFDVELKYDNFTGYANRRVTGGAYEETGISISLGKDQWIPFLNQLTGSPEWYVDWFLTPCSTAEWQRNLAEERYGLESINQDAYAEDAG